MIHLDVSAEPVLGIWLAEDGTMEKSSARTLAVQKTIIIRVKYTETKNASNFLFISWNPHFPFPAERSTRLLIVNAIFKQMITILKVLFVSRRE